MVTSYIGPITGIWSAGGAGSSPRYDVQRLGGRMPVYSTSAGSSGSIYLVSGLDAPVLLVPVLVRLF